MIEVARIAVALLCGGVLGAVSVKAYSRADDWLVRVRSVSSMYRKAK
jgi:hypothetical protein